jgi:hypothetical protein
VQWLDRHGADLIRISAIVRDNAFTGAHEDDAEAFFRRSPWAVSNADMWRWFAVCSAVREIRRRWRRPE